MSWLLPALAVFPIISAFVCYITGRHNKEARFDMLIGITAVEFIGAAWLLACAFRGNLYTFDIGGVCALGLHFKADGFRALYATVAGLMWLMTSIFSREYFRHYHNRSRYALFTLITLGATVGLFLSDDLYTAFIFFEIMSLASYAWVAHDEKPAAMRAAETYLAVAVIGGMAALMGIFMFYDQLGTLSFEGMLARVSALESKQSLYLPGILVLIGFGAKAGMFPFHIWLPKAHPVAPAPASALLSGMLTKTGVFGILVLSGCVFLHDAAWGNLILALGTITMLLGAVLALFSTDLKKTLACSSMSQIGFILVGVGMQGLLGHEDALDASGTILHMVNHSLIKLTLFMVAGVIYMDTHKLELNAIRGFGRGKPLLHFCFLMGALGIAGVPLWNGFVSKSLLHEGLLEYIAHLSALGEPFFLYKAVELIFLFTGGVTAAYMTKLYVAIFIDKPDEKPRVSHRKTKGKLKTSIMPHYMCGLSGFALCVSAALLPILGFFAEPLMSAISDLSVGFLHASKPAHAVHYLTYENLMGSFKSLGIGALVYFFVVRKLLMRKNADGVREYVDRWPKWLDLEDGVYRPAIAALLSVLGGVSLALDRLPDFAMRALNALGNLLGRVADGLVDGVSHLAVNTVLSARRLREPVPVGNRLTYSVGRVMDACVALLNKTVRRNRPIATRFVYVLAATWEELQSAGQLARSLSFGLLLLAVGLLLALCYLLA